MEVKGIIVVDDDGEIRETIASSLVEMLDHCQIATFEDGEAAWQSIVKDGALLDLIHLVITDLDMPKMDGMTLLGKVKKKYPEIKVIMISGTKSDIERKLALAYGVDRFLKKPFKLEQLQKAIQELLS